MRTRGLSKVDSSRAEQLPGVVAVLTRDDLIGDHIDPYFGLFIQDQTPVALDRVRFVGDPVAAVAALDDETAAEALDLIDVEYEELPAVFDAEEALKPGAVLLPEGARRVIPGRTDITARSQAGTNIVHLFKQRKGNIAQGFRGSGQIFENAFRSPPVNHAALEPHVVVAQVDDGPDYRLDELSKSLCGSASIGGNLQSPDGRRARDCFYPRRRLWWKAQLQA